ncbi:hypothetical protein RRG08_033413 [Elysia crispata]|uniref:Uncharacterized protein n=1 Tax=Elysia crispata TaxID=231223 RepID=A0AAE1DR48_9GAST|nr:hypothetical protein RRG08_033413 [Elysia crispata]
MEKTTVAVLGKNQAPNKDNGSGSNTGAIAGSVVGAVVFLALIGGLVGFLYFRRRRNDELNSQYIEITEKDPASSESHGYENSLFRA